MTPASFLAISVISLVVAHSAATATKVLQDIAWHELKDYSRRKDKKRFDVIHDFWEEVATGTETLLYLAIAIHVFFGIAWVSTSDLIGFANLFDFVLGVSIGTTVLLGAVVWFPKAIAEHAGTSYLFHTWALWQSLSSLLRPLTFGADVVAAVIRRLFNVTEEESEEEALEEEIRTIVAEGQHDGLLDSDTRDMIEGVIELDDANVADIMTPRNRMDVISADVEWNELLAYVADVGRTRIPVYEGNKSNFIGVLYVKDLFAQMSQPSDQRKEVRELLRKQWKVPMSLHLDELLQQFRQTRDHLALVVDEYNSVAGLVTIEDVLEEIVGEIVDESDKEAVGDIRVIDGRTAEVLGRTHLEEINEQLGYDFPVDDEFDTIGGFLMHRIGQVPKQGDAVYWNDVHVTVLEASGRRAELVQIEAVDRAPSDSLSG